MNKVRLILVLTSIVMQSCETQTGKINGVSFVASTEAINDSHVKPVVNVNANYAAIMPFGFIKELDEPEIVFNTKIQWYGETREGVKQYIGELRKENIKIMLKPQIWVWHGEFTGFIEMDNEANWKTLEETYSKFILEYANLAEEVDVEIFCIGTELERFVDNRPTYWKNLIVQIKKVYKGKLTYAANWNEYNRTPFWNDLDFIGIDAYFPLSEKRTPTLQDCMTGWKQHKTEIHKFSLKHQKPILFTEYGYRSLDYAGKEPWDSDNNKTQVNLEAQVNATQALFETFWKEDWFAGGFVWKWFHNHNESGGKNNARFTPQNKPVESLIKKYYGLHK